MRRNHNTNHQSTAKRFALGQTFITPGAEEALQIAGQTALEFLRRHMSCDWGELSEDDVQENELSLKEGFRLLSNYRTAKGQQLYVTWNKGSRPVCFVLGFSVFSIYLSSSRGCGNCGKLDVLCRVFQACGNGGKTRFVFPRFP
jgi:hypothetical protein